MAVKWGDMLLDVCADVVMRFIEHGSYKGEAGAVKALRRRVPGRTQEEYQACFNFLCGVYNRAVAAIDRHHIKRPDKRSRYAEPEDIDSTACLEEMEQIEPGVGLRQKQEILGWAIYWHYLR